MTVFDLDYFAAEREKSDRVGYLWRELELGLSWLNKSSDLDVFNHNFGAKSLLFMSLSSKPFSYYQNIVCDMLLHRYVLSISVSGKKRKYGRCGDLRNFQPELSSLWVYIH